MHFGLPGALRCRNILKGIGKTFFENMFLMATSVVVREVTEELVAGTVPMVLTLQPQQWEGRSMEERSKTHLQEENQRAANSKLSSR